jgi:DNA-binding Lrp family transcriptional regulator
MEETKLITGYRAILDGKSLGLGVTAFVFVSVSYKPGTKLLSQRKIAEEIAKHPEVQEVQIISGEWDLLLKVKAKDVDEIGKFIVDDLRKIEGVDKTSTVVSLATVKESTALKV